jgi:hypothetical protein
MCLRTINIKKRIPKNSMIFTLIDVNLAPIIKILFVLISHAILDEL